MQGVIDWIALGLLISLIITFAYAIIYIHDIPHSIAVKRNHPQQDALEVAGWISLFTLHVIWPFLWIWATLYREDRGFGFGSAESKAQKTELQDSIKHLTDRVAALENANGGETP